jgi:hypothetical protein
MKKELTDGQIYRAQRNEKVRELFDTHIALGSKKTAAMKKIAQRFHITLKTVYLILYPNK